MLNDSDLLKALGPQPRCQHYHFVHTYLRNYCLLKPEYFFSVMVSEHRNEFLEQLRQASGQYCLEIGGECCDTEIDLVLPFNFHGYAALFIEIAEAERPTEALMVLAVAGWKIGAPRPLAQSARFLTLERSKDYDSNNGEVYFCEWLDAEGHKRANYERLTNVDAHYFCELVERTVFPDVRQPLFSKE